MKQKTQKAKTRYEESTTKLQLLRQEIEKSHFNDSDQTHNFLKNNYLPQAVETHTFYAIWQFEAKFPLGGETYKDNYLRVTFENLYRFFSGEYGAICLLS
ncbi:hypothetical protein [Runella sp.]|uniref:hypothetical protein n=1 Tax=Runella sp. TaxID=1960881 RepID=UPI00301B51FF